MVIAAVPCANVKGRFPGVPVNLRLLSIVRMRDNTIPCPTNPHMSPANSTATLEILNGLTIDSDGTIPDDEGRTIGKPVENNTERLAKHMATCDDDGNTWS